MDVERLEKYKRQLYSRMPLVGERLRRGAAKALAQDGSPEAVRALAEAVTRSDDEQVRAVALERMRHIDTQPCIDAVSAVWAATRHPRLTLLLTKRRWAASSPADVKVLSALKVRRAELVTAGGVEVVRPLVQACQDADPDVARQARKCLARLRDPDAIDALCALVIERDHPLAREIAIAAQYAPHDPHRRALFYFVTGQWPKYEDLDFDHSLLQAAYELADEELRRRVREYARQAGRVEWVEVVAGGRQARRLGEMTDEEWTTALAVLGERRQWQEMWRLAQVAPAVWSVRLLRRLRETEWFPGRDGERGAFTELARLAEECEGKPLGPGLGLPVRCRITLQGHRSGIDCLAISPDSRLLASGSRDTTVWLWRLPNGAPLATLQGHRSGIDCLAISPDGRLLASGSCLDGTVRLWRLPDGALLATLKVDTHGVKCLAISPDGRLLAGIGSSLDGRVWLWRLPDGALLATLEGEGGYIGEGECLAISPDGRVLASGNGDGSVRLWRLPDGAPLAACWCGQVWCLAISPDGRVLASGGDDNTVRLWRLPDGAPLATLQGHTSGVQCLAISPDGRVLASESGDKTVRLWHLPDGAPLATLQGHTDRVLCLVISPDSRLLASGGGYEDKMMRLWRLPDGEPLATLEVGTGGVRFLAISPDGRMLASRSWDGKVRLWTSLGYLPIGRTSLEDMAWAQETLRDGEMTGAERSWLEFTLALMRWQRRFDIELEEAPARIPAGEFDIELGE